MPPTTLLRQERGACLQSNTLPQGAHVFQGDLYSTVFTSLRLVFSSIKQGEEIPPRGVKNK